MSAPTTDRAQAIAAAADQVVQRASSSSPGVPGVVAGVTDRERNLYLAPLVSGT